MTTFCQKNDLSKYDIFFLQGHCQTTITVITKKHTKSYISINYTITKNGTHFADLRMCLVVDR